MRDAAHEWAREQIAELIDRWNASQPTRDGPARRSASLLIVGPMDAGELRALVDLNAQLLLLADATDADLRCCFAPAGAAIELTGRELARERAMRRRRA